LQGDIEKRLVSIKYSINTKHMKIKTTYHIGEYENTVGISIEIDDKEEFSVHEGEPEDMSFGRNLSDIHSIPDMLQAAYEAGKRGEELVMEQEDEE